MYKPSKYLERFNKLTKVGPKGALEGNVLLIEILEEEEDLRKTDGGIIIAKSSHVRAQFEMHSCVVAIILQVGQGTYDPSTDTIYKLDREAGNIIQVAGASLSYESTDPLITEGIPENILARIDDRSIIRSWDNMEDYLLDLEAVSGKG